MRVGTRLYLAVLPAVLGVLLVAAVAGLSSEVAAEREVAASRVGTAESRAEEYASLLDEALAAMTIRVDDAHMPLHILLSSPFGELNENQEEILCAAEQAIDAADVELRRIRKLLDVERGAISFVPQPIGVGALLRPAIAIAEARAASMHVRMVVAVPDALRRVVVDPVQAQEALASIFRDAVNQAAAGGEVVVTATEGAAGQVVIAVSPGGAGDASGERPPVEMRLARRLIAVQGGAVRSVGNRTVVALPAER